MAFNNLSYEIDSHGVAIITIDVPGHKHNVLTPELHVVMGEVAARLAHASLCNRPADVIFCIMHAPFRLARWTMNERQISAGTQAPPGP